MPKRGKTYEKTITNDCFLYLYMILLKRHFPFFKMKSTFIGFVSQIFVLCLLKNDEISLLGAFHCHTVFAESCITTRWCIVLLRTRFQKYIVIFQHAHMIDGSKTKQITLNYSLIF